MARNVASVLREMQLVKTALIREETKLKLVRQLEAELEAVAAMLPDLPPIAPNKGGGKPPTS